MTTPTNSTLLPMDARLELQRAAQTENTPADPLRRQKAIEKATQRIKARYPQFFKKELHHENQA